MQEILLRNIKYRLEDIEKLLKWRIPDFEAAIKRLRERNAALEVFVQRVIDDEQLCLGAMAVSDYEAKYGRGAATQLLGTLARVLLEGSG